MMRSALLPLLLLTTVATPALAQSSDVVIRGSRAHPSNWREAQTNHVIVLSDGPEAELVRMTRNMERLNWLLSGLLGRPYGSDDKVRIRVTLIGDVAEFESLDLANKRWQQGPFNDRFQITRYYDPRQDGAVMASTRVDQRTVIELTQNNAHSILSSIQGTNLVNPTNPMNAAGDPSAQAAIAGALIGDFATAGMVGEHDLPLTYGEHAIDVPAESLLYAGYAQHFLQTYFPAAYPRWYLDGFGQIFASFVTKGDNSLEFGRSPKGTQAVLDEFGGFPIADILNDKYLTEKPHKTNWTPIHAWLLTHFLFFSDMRRPQLRQYLAARAAGQDAATAAAVFGDQKVLTKELRAYFGAKKPYESVAYRGGEVDTATVRRLSEGEAAFIKGRLELGGRILIPAAPGPGLSPDDAAMVQRARDEAIRKRDQWLARLRKDAARYPEDESAQLLLAEAECRSGNPANCLAAAGRAAQLSPSDARPPVWQGLAMAAMAADAPPAERPTKLAAARAMIIGANRNNTGAVEPLLAYFQSFAVSGEAPTVNAIDGLQQAVSQVPNAPESRLALAQALAGRGQADVARQVAMPIAAGAYDSPEKPAAQAIVAGAGSGASGTGR